MPEQLPGSSPASQGGAPGAPVKPNTPPAGAAGRPVQEAPATVIDLTAAVDAGSAPSADAGAIAGPEAYRAELPADFQLPENARLVVDEANPLLLEARQFAHEAGMNQGAFSKLLALQAKVKLSEREQLIQRAEQHFEEQRQKLGPNHDARVNAAASWLKGKLPDQLFQSIAPLIVDADMILAFEALMKHANGPIIPGAVRPDPPPARQLSIGERLYPNMSAQSTKKQTVGLY